MKPIGVVLVLALAVLGGSAVVVGASLAAQPSAVESSPLNLRGNFDYARATAFEGYGLFAPGASFQGVPLAAVTRVLTEPNPRLKNLKPRRANWVNFIYASGCAAKGAEVGCERMVQVQVWPACERNRSVYTRASEVGDVELVMTEVRGVPAAYFEREQRLEVYTGDSTIVLFGDDDTDLFELAKSVSSVNSATLGRARVEANAALAQPAAGSLSGQLTCSGSGG
jgi:hypothetical protein